MSTPPRHPSPLKQKLSDLLQNNGTLTPGQRMRAEETLRLGGGHWTWRLAEVGVPSSSIRAALVVLRNPPELQPPPETSSVVNATMAGEPLPAAPVAVLPSPVLRPPTVQQRAVDTLMAAPLPVVPAAPLPWAAAVSPEPAPAPAAHLPADTLLAAPPPSAPAVVRAPVPVARPQALPPGVVTPAAVGEMLGPYRLTRQLGQGGMASVFLGEHAETGTLVAVKLMLPHLATDAGFVRRFLAEAQASVGMTHENVASVISHGEDAGRYYMVFEYVDGGTLEQHLEAAGPLPWPLVLELGIQMLRGMAYAHRFGIIHRDLKPANLLLSRAGVLKVADFGVAKQEGVAMTKTGTMVGTPMYLSPEMASGRPVDARCDLYTVGVILRELLTGRNPFFSENVGTSITLILTGGHPTLFAENPCVPAALDHAIETMMLRAPELRHGNAEEVLESLEALRVASLDLTRDSLSRVAADPAETAHRLRVELADRYVLEAQDLLKQTHAERPAAAFKLYCALRLAPEHHVASALFEPLCRQDRLSFAPVSDPRVAEVERSLQQTGDTPPALQQLAQVLRSLGSLHACAAAWRRYLRLRPDDGFAQNQLLAITRELPPPPRPPAVAAAPGREAPGGQTMVDRLAPGAAPGAMRRGLSAPVPAHVPEDTGGSRKRLVLLLCALAVGGTAVSYAGKRFRKSAEESMEAARVRRSSGGGGQAGTTPGSGGEPTHKPTGAPAVRALTALGHACGGASDEACVVDAQALETAFPGTPEAARARLLRGHALMRAGRPVEAVDALTSYLETPGATDGPEALLRRAQARRAMKDRTAAMEDLGTLLSGTPSRDIQAQGHLERAELLVEAGDKEGARKDFKTAWRLGDTAPGLRERAVKGAEAAGLPSPVPAEEAP